VRRIGLARIAYGLGAGYLSKLVYDSIRLGTAEGYAAAFAFCLLVCLLAAKYFGEAWRLEVRERWAA
jgi:hypothetical protein